MTAAGQARCVGGVDDHAVGVWGCRACWAAGEAVSGQGAAGRASPRQWGGRGLDVREQQHVPGYL